MSATPPPPPTLCERIGWVMRAWGELMFTKWTNGQFPQALNNLLSRRLTMWKQRIDALKAAVDAGTYVPPAPTIRQPAKPRQDTEPRPEAVAKPRPENPYPKQAGWMQRLIPEAAAIGGAMEQLAHDRELIDLLVIAPESLRREFRRFLWMVGQKPPSAIAPPPRLPQYGPRKPRARRPVPYEKWPRYQQTTAWHRHLRNLDRIAEGKEPFPLSPPELRTIRVRQ